MSDLISLFALDPNKYSQQDLDAIIRELRGMRHAFNAGNMKAGSTKPKTPKEKEAEKLSEGMDLNIDL